MFDDPTRLKTLARVAPSAREPFERLIAEATRRGYMPHIVSAVRTCQEQGGLAATRAKRSWHVFGHAIDLELHKGAPKDDPAKLYRELGEWWEAQGGTWGGRWTELYPVAPGVPGASGDPLHFQWTPAPLTEGVNVEFWPRDATCDDVQARADRYLQTGRIPAKIETGAAGARPVPTKKKAVVRSLSGSCYPPRRLAFGPSASVGAGD